MTDEINNDPPKKKASNVKPLHKGIKVDDTPKPVIVDQELITEIKKLLTHAEKGELIGLIYATANSDYTSDYFIIGDFPIPDRMQNVLRVLDDDFYEFIVRPIITGEFGDTED